MMECWIVNFQIIIIPAKEIDEQISHPRTTYNHR